MATIAMDDVPAGELTQSHKKVIFASSLGTVFECKVTFLITIVIMGSATLLVGLLPGYDRRDEPGGRHVVPARDQACRYPQLNTRQRDLRPV